MLYPGRFTQSRLSADAGQPSPFSRRHDRDGRGSQLCKERTRSPLAASGKDKPEGADPPRDLQAGGAGDQQLRIRVLSVDDHPLLREGIAAIINSQPDMVLSGMASTGREGIQKFHEHRPDITLMDLRLPDLSGIDALIAIRSAFPDARVIMLSTFKGDMDIQRALKAGAYGYLLKSGPRKDLVDAIRKAHLGRKSVAPDAAERLAEHLNGEALTEREIEVLRLIANGERNKEIADRLSIADQTVKVHVRHIMEKLGANDRTEAMVIAARRGIISI